LKHLAKSIPADKLNDNKPFLDAINERQYTKALRRACTSTDEQTALKLIKVLMSYKGRLSFNVNEQAGPEQLTALHYAAKSANSEIFDFLIRQDADQTIVDKAGMKARDYMQNVNLQRKVQA
jgi:ankyrin repeat protein